MAFNIDSRGVSRTLLLKYPKRIIKKVAFCLFLSSPYISGKVSPASTVCVYTEIEKDGHLFRAHPCFLRRDIGMVGLILNGMVRMNLSQEGY